MKPVGITHGDRHDALWLELQAARAGAAAAVAAIEKELMVARAEASKAKRAAEQQQLGGATSDLTTAAHPLEQAPSEAATASACEELASEQGVDASSERRPPTADEESEVVALRERVATLESQIATIRWQAATASEEQEAEVGRLPSQASAYIAVGVAEYVS